LPEVTSGQSANGGRDEKAGKYPEPPGVVDGNDDRVFEKCRSVALDVGFEIVENPSRVGVPQAFEGAMRIFLLVRIGVVLDVGGGPVKGRALHGHRSANEKKSFQPRMSLKAFMGQHPVVTEGDSVTAQGEKGKKKGEINPGDV